MPAGNATAIAGVGLYRKNSPSRLVEGQRLGKKPAAFHLERADGINIRLAHEPVFRRTNDPSFGKIYSWTTVQKPDIFLEISTDQCQGIACFQKLGRSAQALCNGKVEG